MLLPAGYQVVAETPAPTAAPTPPPQGPIQAPPPSASATTTPPVSTAANPTVSMDVAMRIFGSDVVPFTPTAQFVAASALAGTLPWQLPWALTGPKLILTLEQSQMGPESQESMKTNPETIAYACCVRHFDRLMVSPPLHLLLAHVCSRLRQAP